MVSERPINLAISPCPNDTYAFGSLLLGLVPAPEPFNCQFEDIEVLNRMALEGRPEIGKVSMQALLHLHDQYELLDSGAALGFGCGPLLVGRKNGNFQQVLAGPIAIPGAMTTAALLLKLWLPQSVELVACRFDQIMPAVREGRFSAGLIIHESRFTYPNYALKQWVDLGEWWQTETGLPLPLGGIVAKKSLGHKKIQAWSHAIAQSVRHAADHQAEVRPLMRKHAAEMQDEVMDQHVALYVNPFTESLGEIGRVAVNCLLARAAAL